MRPSLGTRKHMLTVLTIHDEGLRKEGSCAFASAIQPRHVGTISLSMFAAGQIIAGLLIFSGTPRLHEQYVLYLALMSGHAAHLDQWQCSVLRPDSARCAGRYTPVSGKCCLDCAHGCRLLA